MGMRQMFLTWLAEAIMGWAETLFSISANLKAQLGDVQRHHHQTLMLSAIRSSGNTEPVMWDIRGQYLIIDCLDFYIYIDLPDQIAHAYGESIELETIYFAPAKGITEFKSFQTDYRSTAPPKPHKTDTTLQFSSCRYNSDKEAWHLISDKVELEFSRKNRWVRVYGIGIKGLFKGRVKGEGPRPHHKTNTFVDEVKERPLKSSEAPRRTVH